MPPARRVSIRADLEFQVLEPCAGREVGVDLGVHVGPVLDAAREAADVDQVEVVGGIRPFAAGIVDFKDEVRRRGGVEDGTEVCGCDLRVGEVVGNVDGPQARAGADVEDARWVADGREEELVVQREQPEVVHD